MTAATTLSFLLAIDLTDSYPYGPTESKPAEVDSDFPLPDAPSAPSYRYIEVMEGCGPDYSGECVNVRSGPGTTYPVVSQLRTGVVLAVSDTVEVDGRKWHKIAFNEWIRYPRRLPGQMYVASDIVRPFLHEGTINGPAPETAGMKRIVVDRSEQTLEAYDGDSLFMQETISTGIALTPTPRGTFHVYKKTPSRYMQGPLPGVSAKFYDLPGVPWNLYFTQQGAVIHGAYWHNSFGKPWSNGCVNLPVSSARKLYEWADIGTTVIVRD